MGLFDGFRRPDFDGELARYRETPGAVLLDVRAPQEYAGGHVPGSQNVPLNQLPGQIGALVPDLGTPVFVYCLSQKRPGGRLSPADGLRAGDRLGRHRPLQRAGGEVDATSRPWKCGPA